MKILFFFIVFVFTGFSQSEPFELINNDKAREDFVLNFKQSNIELTEKKFGNYNCGLKKFLKETISNIEKDFIQEINDKQFTFDERFLKKVNEIVDELNDKNQEIFKNIQILVAKQPTLNAYCLPNGTLIVNMGCFYWLENEDQLAAIIAHEIAHKQLEHGIKNRIKFYDDNFSSKNKKIVKNLALQFNKVDKVFSLYKSQLYENSKISQKNEFEADSLSFLLLQQTKYATKEIINSMKLAVEYDSIKPKGLDLKIFKELFDLPLQPFNENWLIKEDFSSYNYSLYKEKINKDSLLSHPDMSLRIERLEKNYTFISKTNTVEQNTSFKELAKLAEMNIISNLLDLDNYGVAVYNCMLQIQRKNNLDFYKKWLGISFQKIYDARKKYTLNRYLDKINPKEHSESYQQFLSFLWNLKIEEIKNIADFYSHQKNN